MSLHYYPMCHCQQKTVNEVDDVKIELEAMFCNVIKNRTSLDEIQCIVESKTGYEVNHCGINAPVPE